MKKEMIRTFRKVFPKSFSEAVAGVVRAVRAFFARVFYSNPARDLKIIGITGTNGKTTTVNMVNEILKAAGKKTAMFSTAVIEIDGERKVNDMNLTVLPVWELNKFFALARKSGVDYVVLEVSSMALDQKKLKHVRFEVAALTNITQDHLDYHGSMERYAQAKMLLFRDEPRFSVINRDDLWYEDFAKFGAGESVISYGYDKQSDVRILGQKLYRKGTECTLKIGDKKLELATALAGEFNVYNMTLAATIGLALDLSDEAIAEGIANLDSLPGRFELVVDGAANDKGFDVVVDYAHTPDALEQLLYSAREILSAKKMENGRKAKVILVFGAMGERDAIKRPIMGRIAGEMADKIFLTDEENDREPRAKIRAEIMVGLKEALSAVDVKRKVTEIEDRRAAIAEALRFASAGDMILITGLGHEVVRLLDGEKITWSDKTVVLELMSNHQLIDRYKSVIE
ncbi:MAG: UDP-N-acetylmuramoyl-L-alanyl-D-glutamate--2,6-diaminopimelate ligase [Candidatus Nomurabacteria bacterium]|jgi:UDP-N-acetylmuramoyl-L-alanyl-D-glutamate--2,6-diaminopimelate ligase|nr:UDP-N-acetylmuramoyl-L-alanyl-D-glutamate--2,6-diaminopimelate ligase [Candidatus Nomurabacteria bacterium]